MKNNINKWYSVIISILLIWFLLILTIWVFTLVMKEFNDNKWLWDGIKAFAWAEASQELALLKIKEKWYWIWNKIEHEVSEDSIILSDNPGDTENFLAQKDPFISYDLNVLAEYDNWFYSYNEKLQSNQYSIIPLFYEDEVEDNTSDVSDYDLSINWWDRSSLVWNLIAWEEWIGNNWNDLNEWSGKNIDNNWTASYVYSTVNHFLPKNNAYLILFNSGDSEITFTVKSANKFSKPKTKILSSAQVWKYRHNLETEYDNTKFLNMLKYAVFSN